MEHFNLVCPAELSFEGNVAGNWKKWKRNFENYLFAVDLVAEPADDEGTFPDANETVWRYQVAILRRCIGDDIVQVLDQFEVDAAADPPEKNTVRLDVLAKFKAYINPRRNLLYEWYLFWSMLQSVAEPIDVFAKRLKTQAAKCEFVD